MYCLATVHSVTDRQTCGIMSVANHTHLPCLYMHTYIHTHVNL